VANSDGIAVDIKVTIWTDSSNYRQSTVQFKSAVATGQRVDLFMPWSSFTVGSGTLDPASVRAVELELDATVGDDGADMTIRMVKADSVYEYGDLPSSYLTANILQAYHIPKGLRLGNSCDADVTYNASDGADGDDLDQADDEDGVAPYGLPWGTDDWGTVRLRTIGCLDETNGCYVNGWIDWNNDGDFADTDVGGATERIIYRSNVFNGTYNYGFTTPTNWSNNWYYARFRICKTATACDTPTTSDTNVDDGEIEDYRWWLGPTGVDLASFTALGGNGVVSLDWATTNENDLVGFNLWRNTDASSPDTQLNVTLIEAKNAGTPFGSSYSYQDSGVVNGTTYYYWLESVEVGDVRTWHGPASAMPQFRFYLPLVWRQ
jgi:hypothetical protein